jgi:hypothetical protein
MRNNPDPTPSPPPPTRARNPAISTYTRQIFTGTRNMIQVLVQSIHTSLFSNIPRRDSPQMSIHLTSLLLLQDNTANFEICFVTKREEIFSSFSDETMVLGEQLMADILSQDIFTTFLTALKTSTAASRSNPLTCVDPFNADPFDVFAAPSPCDRTQTLGKNLPANCEW